MNKIDRSIKSIPANLGLGLRTESNLRQAVLLFAAAAFSGLTGCLPSRVHRAPEASHLFDKHGGAAGKLGAKQLGSEETYVNRPKIEIVSAAADAGNGSLFNPDDSRNDRFTEADQRTVGRTLAVQVLSPRIDAKKTEAGTSVTKDDEASSQDELTKTLLAGLPELTPVAGEERQLVKQVNFKIQQIYPNGDGLGTLVRRSRRAGFEQLLQVRVRIPAAQMLPNAKVDTNDLTEVRVDQVQNGERTVRSSHIWEDEYTLALSGFEEAKSQVAQDLEDQKRQLFEVRDRLRGRIEAFGAERRQLAEQREKLQNSKVANAAQIDQLKGQLQSKDDVISEQQQQIQSLRPQDKPGDEKDVNDGR